MADIKVQLVVDGVVHSLEEAGVDGIIEGLKVKRDYKGAEPSTEYGDVAVQIDGKPITLRIGGREWFAAEEKFKIKGVLPIIRHINSSEKARAEFYLIALSRHHPKLKLEDVADMMDYVPENGGPTLADALDRCLHFSKPAIFRDEDIDPKGKAALEAALLLLASRPTKTQESKTSSE